LRYFGSQIVFQQLQSPYERPCIIVNQEFVHQEGNCLEIPMSLFPTSSCIRLSTRQQDTRWAHVSSRAMGEWDTHPPLGSMSPPPPLVIIHRPMTHPPSHRAAQPTPTLYHRDSPLPSPFASTFDRPPPNPNLAPNSELTAMC
jgi:hypothetical protein